MERWWARACATCSTPPTLDRARDQIFDDIASALAYAHEEGVVHGVSGHRTSWSCARAWRDRRFRHRATRRSSATLHVARAATRRPVDHRSDLFPLGALFYEMLTRRALFEGNSPQEIMENILRGEPPLPSELNLHVPGALDRLVVGLLAGHPDDRVADARSCSATCSASRKASGWGRARAPASASRLHACRRAGPSPGCARPLHTNRATARRRTKLVAATRSDRAGGAPTCNRTRTRPAHARPERIPRPRADAGCPSARRARCEVHDGPRTGAETLFRISRGRLGGTRPHARSAWTYRLLVLLARPQRTTQPPRHRLCKQANPRLRPLRRRHHRRAQWAMRERSKSHWASHPRRTRCRRNRSRRNPALRQELRACRPASLSNPQQPALRPRKRRRGHHNRGRKSRSRSLGGTARLIIAVSPRGELYIDGKHHGTTPPITTLVLEPGMHRIEIRSGSRKPYLTYMAVQAGEQRRIRHDFGAKPSGPST